MPFSLLPSVTTASDALDTIRRFGAAIVPGIGSGTDDAQQIVREIYGSAVLALPEPAAVREGGDKDRVTVESGSPLPLHSDGFAYGDQPGDVLVLVCVRPGVTGGESVLVDGAALVDSLDEDLRRFLTEVPVDVSEPGMRPAISPVVLTLAGGRRIVRWNPFLRPAPESADPDGDARMLARWTAVTEEARVSARRFMASEGDAIVVDNFRMLHSRDAFTGERFMWRVWAWTDAANGVPTGMLHSDSRYAAT